MRRIVVHMQTTLNNRIANAEGTFWEPFPWGEAEQAYVNDVFRSSETWALSRVMYQAIVPWWDQVAAGGAPYDAPDLTRADLEFAALQHETTNQPPDEPSARAAQRPLTSHGEAASIPPCRRQWWMR